MHKPALLPQTGPGASARRITGLVLRYWYVIRSSWPRTAELIYWPLVQMLMWGFLQSHLSKTTSLAGQAAGLFIFPWDFKAAALVMRRAPHPGHVMMLSGSSAIAELRGCSWARIPILTTPMPGAGIRSARSPRRWNAWPKGSSRAPRWPKCSIT